MPEICLVRSCLYCSTGPKSTKAEISELVVSKSRMYEVGYSLIAFPVNLVSIDSLAFISICRQIDLFILPVSFVCNASTAKMSQRLYEATAYGCRFIFFGEKIDDVMWASKIQFLKEIGNVVETLTGAVDIAEKLLDVESIAEDTQFDKDLETGKPKVVMDGDNPSSVPFMLMDGDTAEEYRFIEVTNLCIPHPFDENNLENKLRFILGHGVGKVLVCGVFRVDGYENQPGYVIKEERLIDSLPVDWKSQWENLVHEKGFQVVMQKGWTFSHPPENAPDADPMIVGGEAFNLNGVHVVQTTPFCLSYFDDE